MITYGAVYCNSLHLLIVVVFLLPVGTLVEKRLGSIHFANILVVFTVLVPLIHLLLETVLLYFYSDLLYECFVGFSSVLFGIFVLEVCSAKQRWESILGSVSLSWWIVPWLSAILCEVITGDHVAFLGHISGLIVGHMCILWHGPYVCLYTCKYVCMYVCLYTCMYVRMYVCMFVYLQNIICVYVCILAYMCVCLYTCMYVCMFVYLHVCVCCTSI